jgi:hypothetical protein
VSAQRPIHPEYVASVIDDIADDDAIFTADTGMCCTWTARYLTPNGRRHLLGSFVHGSMANALPMAIGAQISHPGRQVISLSGDGGLAMLLGELLTMKTHRLPIKIVVFNNSSLGMVRLEMMVAGDPPFETDHDPVNYAAIAAAAGFHTKHVTDPANSQKPPAKSSPTTAPPSSTSSPHPTPSKYPHTSPSPKHADSPYPSAKPSSPEASAKSSTSPEPTCATSQVLNDDNNTRSLSPGSPKPTSTSTGTPVPSLARKASSARLGSRQ